MFNVDPKREPDHSPRQSRMPLAQAPAKPRSWWGTIPGQIALLVILGGIVVIALGLAGVIGPLSMR